MIDPNGLANEVFQTAHLTAPDLPIESTDALDRAGHMSRMKIEDIDEISEFFNTSVSIGDTENLINSYYSEKQQEAITSSIVESVIGLFAPTGTGTVMRNETSKKGTHNGDVYFKEYLPTTMETQIGPTCVLFSLAFASEHLLGSKVNVDQLLTYLLTTFGMSVLSNDPDNGGIIGENVIHLIDYFFEVGNFSTFKESIDAGVPVFSSFPIDPSNVSKGGHGVLVVGYEQNSNMVICMDPELGTLIRKDANEFFGEKYPLIKNK